jgi:hypothetical protein
LQATIARPHPAMRLRSVVERSFSASNSFKSAKYQYFKH